MAYHEQVMLNIRDVCWTLRNFVCVEGEVQKGKRNVFTLWTFQLI